MGVARWTWCRSLKPPLGYYRNRKDESSASAKERLDAVACMCAATLGSKPAAAHGRLRPTVRRRCEVGESLDRSRGEKKSRVGSQRPPGLRAAGGDLAALEGCPRTNPRRPRHCWSRLQRLVPTANHARAFFLVDQREQARASNLHIADSRLLANHQSSSFSTSPPRDNVCDLLAISPQVPTSFAAFEWRSSMLH